MADTRSPEPGLAQGAEPDQIVLGVAERHPIGEDPVDRFESVFDHPPVEPVHAAQRFRRHDPGSQPPVTFPDDRPDVRAQHQLGGVGDRGQIGGWHRAQVGPAPQLLADAGAVEHTAVVGGVRVNGASDVARQRPVGSADRLASDGRRHPRDDKC